MFVCIAMERSTILNGKAHHFYGPSSIAIYQRVLLIEQSSLKVISSHTTLEMFGDYHPPRTGNPYKPRGRMELMIQFYYYTDMFHGPGRFSNICPNKITQSCRYHLLIEHSHGKSTIRFTENIIYNLAIFHGYVI